MVYARAVYFYYKDGVTVPVIHKGYKLGFGTFWAVTMEVHKWFSKRLA